MSRPNSEQRRSLDSFTTAPSIPLFEGLLVLAAGVVLVLFLSRPDPQEAPTETRWPEASATPALATATRVAMPPTRIQSDAIVVIGDPQAPRRTVAPAAPPERPAATEEFSTPIMPEVVAPPE